MRYEFLTKFVRDRFAETPWAFREYIKNLQGLEEIISSGGSKAFAEAMYYNRLKSKYPVEAECIKLELDSGIYTDPEEFNHKCDQYRLQEWAEREAEAQEEKAKRLANELKERKSWLEAKKRLAEEMALERE